MSETVIIVGAPRSGTNMLRDVLTSLPGLETWECDEINLLWKHGNVSVPHDELTPAHATPEVIRYLRGAFERFAAKKDATMVVEKTCATSLRVAFTAKVFPDAKFVFIRRDGLDAAASAMKRWNAPFDLAYTLKKVRYVPVRDLPIHLSSFVGKRIRQRISGAAGASDGARKVETWWGPRPHDFKQLQHRHSLDEVAFIQWKRCVDLTRRDLAQMPQDQVLEVVYEQFVRDPQSELRRILEFMGKPDLMDESAVSSVKVSSVGKGREQLGPEVVARLEEIGHDSLAELGYA